MGYRDIQDGVLGSRWGMFFKTLERCLMTGQKFDEEQFRVDLLHTTHCTLNTAHCTLYTTHCTE